MNTRQTRHADAAADGVKTVRRPRPRFRLHPLALALASGLLPGISEVRAQVVPRILPKIDNPLPTLDKVVNGQASIARPADNRMVVTNSNGAIIHWKTFDIAGGHAVRFDQPDAASQVLNRVTGNDLSQIMGTLSSNGKVWLVNPHGVLFGQNAVVNVAGLVVSSLAVRDADFLAGKQSFGRAGDAAGGGGVVNDGVITTTYGGRVLMIGGAQGVHNAGSIVAEGGRVVLAAGSTVDLLDTGTPNVTFRVDPQQEGVRHVVANHGRISVAGGAVDLQSALVNQSGVVRADAFERGPSGEIMLRAAVTTVAAAAAAPPGTDGDGGEVHLSGQHAVVSGDASISADAGRTGHGGRIVVRGEDVASVRGQLRANGGSAGGDGGAIETIGGRLDVNAASVSASSGPKGNAGRWLVRAHDIDIVASPPIVDLAVSEGAADLPQRSVLLDRTVSAALESGLHVEVAAGGVVPQAGGTLTVQGAALGATLGGSMSLGLRAEGDLTVGAGSSVFDDREGTVLDLGLHAGGTLRMEGKSSVDVSGGVTLAGRTVHLQKDAAVRSGRSGDAIVVRGASERDGASFVNEAGPGALATNARGRWLVYASEPERVALGGLPYSFKQYDARFDERRVNRDGSIATPHGGHGLLFAAAPVATLDGPTVAKVYDADAASTLAGKGVTVAGLLDGDAASVGTVLSGRFDSPDAGRRPFRVTDGIEFVDAQQRPVFGYRLAPLDGRIDPRPLTFDIAVAGKVYDGKPDASVAVDGIRGLVGEQQLGVAASGRFENWNAGPDRPVAVEVTLGDGTGGGKASNYVVAPLAPHSAQIFRKDVTLGGMTAADKVYDGGVKATFTLGALSGLVGSEQLTVSASGGFTDPNAGSRTVEVEATLADGSHGGLASNYRLTNPTLSQDATIAQKDVTIDGFSAKGKVYDGRRDAEYQLGALKGLVGSEQLDVNASGGFNDPNAGSRTVEVEVTLADGSHGGLASNYRLTNPTLSQGATIARKDVTIDGLVAQGKVYDGRRDAEYQLGALKGLVGSEQLTVNASGGFTDPNAGSRTVRVDATLADGSHGGLASNYRLANDTLTTQATIDRRPVTVGGIAAADKVYDGDTSARITHGPVVGLVGNESLAVGMTGRFDTKDAGQDKLVTIGTTVADGANGGLAANYDVRAGTQTTRADITPKDVTVAGATAADKVYDGGTAARITLGGLDGLVGGETLALQGAGRFDDRNVGRGKTVTVDASIGDGAGGGLASNYRLANPRLVAEADIAPATLTYVAAPGKVAIGGSPPPLGGTVTGFVGGDTLATATTGTPSFSTPARPGSRSGDYPIEGAGLDASNYVFVQDPANAAAFTVLPPLTALDRQTASDLHAPTLPGTLYAAAPAAARPARAVDATAAWRIGSTGGPASFGAVPVGEMSEEALVALLQAREKYKREVFGEAIARLEQEPGLADAPECLALRQLEDGDCLITPALKAELEASRAGMAAEARAPEGTATTTAAAAPAGEPAAGASPQTFGAEQAERLIETNPTASIASTFSSLLKRKVKSAALPQIERKIAVLIGVDRYADTRIPALDNAVGDARSMARLLESELGYETVVVENATRPAIIKALNKVAAEAGPADSVTIYYAGHGQVAPGTRLGYWQPADADASRPETWLSNADIEKLLAQVSASQVALISDSCYSGALVSGERIRGRSESVDPKQLLERKAVVVMSSGGNEPVFDAGKNGHSPFAWNLMRALEQVSRWQVGGNVFERVRFAVARELPQRPQYGTSAQAGHQPGSDYLFEQRQLESPQ